MKFSIQQPFSNSQEDILAKKKCLETHSNNSESTFQDLEDLAEQENKQYIPEEIGIQRLAYIQRQKFHLQQTIQSYKNAACINISACCRRYYKLHELIKGRQPNHFYLDFETGFDPANQIDLVQKMCGLSNSLVGGTLDIGVKQTLIKKYRVPFGYLLTQEEMRNVEEHGKFCRDKIEYKVKFIPIQHNPQMIEDYANYILFDQNQLIQKNLFDHVSCIPDACVIRVIVFPGNKDDLLSCSGGQNGVKQVFPIYHMGEIKLYETGQEVLRLYKNKLQGKNEPISKHQCVQLPQSKRAILKRLDQNVQFKWDKREKEVRRVLEMVDNMVKPFKDQKEICECIGKFQFREYLDIQEIQNNHFSYNVRILVDTVNGPCQIVNDLADYLTEFCDSVSQVPIRTVHQPNFGNMIPNHQQQAVQQMNEFTGILCIFKRMPNNLKWK